MAPSLNLKQLFVDSGRLRAFLIHLAASAAIVTAVGALMLWLWFPQPWFIHDGGWFVYRVILLVDVVLGPLLTLIIFRRDKPDLQRDLSIIVAVQLAALAFGVSTMYQHRPAFIVYGEGNFFTVTWAEVRENTPDISRLEPLRAARGPAFVLLRAPSDPLALTEFRALRRSGGPSLVSYGRYFERITEADWQDIFSRGPRVEQLAKEDPGIAEDLRRFNASNTIPPESLGFVPVVCRRTVIMLIIDRRSATIVDWLS